MEVSGQIHPSCPLNWRLDGPRNQSVGSGEENNYFRAVNGTLHRPASRLLSVPQINITINQISLVTRSGLPRNFVRGGQQRTEDIEKGDLGAVAP